MMRQRRRGAHRKEATLPENSLTPLIDTVLVLLVIFMVSMPVMQQAIKVNLPQGEAGDAKGKQEDIFVWVSAQKDVYVNNELATKNFITVLQNKVKDPKQFVFVNADGALKYEEVHDVITNIKKGGISRVALSSRPRSRTA